MDSITEEQELDQSLTPLTTSQPASASNVEPNSLNLGEEMEDSNSAEPPKTAVQGSGPELGDEEKSHAEKTTEVSMSFSACCMRIETFYSWPSLTRQNRLSQRQPWPPWMVVAK